ncbi:flagellar transcriptional activator FlhD [Kosakonia radicincitans DSM 16656]|uniref:Flagellar transcriptional regulator FlhD n=1 Tax=Kosakonia radicincitans TaxID=283686 RepID=A0AAX2EQU0_9ENTR|nr:MULTISPECIES: flagellar transcriptional regulator FlhD [Kosakonia]MDP9566090.1 flagellar transcriptional activator FlhD [Kosakonia oryzae]APG19376.1 flagellar transcriptional activator FlhD [Kosakonia radicincitans]ARD59490.1 flagellar transcriptional activator FlhD [Kosakonia radicincitans DSM 16656]KDE35051.1 transcriptional regulator [Kosakonia radicincitans UMEnt01/12]NCF08070.1 flagellar transcriptional regulator FlhD [Kosakonia sp. MH5]
MNVTAFDEPLQCIRDMNLSYLLLAQRLIMEDKLSATFRLGLNESTIDMLKDLSLSQLIKLSSTGQLICRLRIDSDMVIDCLTKDSRIDALQNIHTGIILSTELLNSLAEEERPAA